MIFIDYSVRESLIPGAGKGLYCNVAIPAGKVLIAPSKIQQTISLRELLNSSDCFHMESSIRWFEDHCTVSPDWPDECYVNHSFTPNALWHLGFIFSERDLNGDEEITIDYRHLLAPDVDIGFPDSVTGKRIVGYSWKTSLRKSTETLCSLLDRVEQLEINE